jgi:hypothetical protein
VKFAGKPSFPTGIGKMLKRASQKILKTSFSKPHGVA